ncbi:MAG: HAMP domain-containing protein, partial [Myxococcota bacterium]
MKHGIPWTRTLGGRLGAILVVITLLVGVAVAVDVWALRQARQGASTVAVMGETPRLELWALLLAERRVAGLEVPTGEIERLLAEEDARFERAEAAVARLEEPELTEGVRRRRARWQGEIRPGLLEVARAEDPAALRERLDATEASMRTQLDDMSGGIERNVALLDAHIARLQYLQYGALAGVAVVALFALRAALSVGARARALAEGAERVAGGDLGHEVAVEGDDELAQVAASFNGMTARVREMLEAEKAGREHLERILSGIRNTANGIASSTAELFAGVQQQGASAQEQAAAVAQTVSTVD